MLRQILCFITLIGTSFAVAVPVKSNLAAKACDFASTTKPPESAFVEYLESTGTQYINLPIASATNITAVIRVVATRQEQYSKWLFGYVGGGGTRMMGVAAGLYSGKFRFGWSMDGVSSYTPFPPEITTEQTIIISPTNVICKVGDAAVYESTHTGWKYVGNKCSIYTVNASTGRMGWFRIFNLQMYRADALILDLRPVRFLNDNGEQEGAMYDAVSGTILRNAGKGKFLYGKDVSTLDI